MTQMQCRAFTVGMTPCEPFRTFPEDGLIVTRILLTDATEVTAIQRGFDADRNKDPMRGEKV
jgi:hypothetical protein